MCAFVLGEYAAVKQQSCLIIAAAAAGLWLLSAAWRTKKRPPACPGPIGPGGPKAVCCSPFSRIYAGRGGAAADPAG